MPKKSERVSGLPRMVIRKAIMSQEFLRLEYDNGLKINWTTDPKLASPYSSKYAAKSHIDVLRANFEIPKTVIIEPLVM